MSDMMLIGVLRMPLPDNPDPLTLHQFIDRARQAADRIEADAALIAQQAQEIERLKAQRVPLTDAECDAIYRALNAWAREVDAYDFGLPMFAADGHVGGRAVIRSAVEAAHGIHPLQRLADLSKEIGEKP